LQDWPGGRAISAKSLMGFLRKLNGLGSYIIDGGFEPGEEVGNGGENKGWFGERTRSGGEWVDGGLDVACGCAFFPHQLLEALG
jgi:hypothetical protein